MRAAVKGFRDFLLEGDLVTVAIGLVMALVTYAVVSSLVEDLITPLIAAIFSEPSFDGLTFTINDSEFRYGSFINAVVTFITTAAALYVLIVVPYKAYRDRRADPATVRPCPECTSEISIEARRCPHCTATVTPETV